MASKRSWKKRWGTLALAVIVSAAGTAAARAAGETATGPKSGLQVPRFVSLKPDRVNVRGGPTRDHEVTFVYTRAGLPVEITAESDNWRRIRDWEGSEGWVYHSLLSGRRTAVVSPKDKSALVPHRRTRLRWLDAAGAALGSLSQREGGVAEKKMRPGKRSRPHETGGRTAQRGLRRSRTTTSTRAIS